MTSYNRLGMHLLYYGGTQIKFLHTRSVEKVLKDLSVHVSAILIYVTRAVSRRYALDPAR